VIIILLTGLTLAASRPLVAAPDVGRPALDPEELKLRRFPTTLPDSLRLQSLVAGNNRFACDLQRQLYDPRRNLFYSPWSLSQALAMTYAGARGETETQMARVLHFALPQPELHAAFGTLGRSLTRGGEGKAGEEFRLQSANALWAQAGSHLREDFHLCLETHYGALPRQVDFRRPRVARDLINQWGRDHTGGRIHELIPPGLLNPETALVLTNAIYFKAAWLHAFHPAATHPGLFQLLDGGSVEVPLMSRRGMMGYSEIPDLKAVELLYAGERISLVVLLPAVGEFKRFAGNLTAEHLAAVLADLKPAGVQLTLPKFKLGTEYRLREPLMQLGMPRPFGNADFSGMDGTRELFIREVCHAAFIDLDEEGTEATAATAVVMERKGAPAEHTFRIDRPFLFLIRDRASGTILFMGQVVNPLAGEEK